MKLKDYIIIGLVLAIGIAVWQVWQQKKNLDNFLDNVSILNDSIEDLNKKVNANGDTIYQQRQTILTQEQAIAVNIINYKNLKANNIKLLQSYVSLQEKFYATNVLSGYSGTPAVIFVKDSTGGSEYLKIPQSFSYNSKWFGWNGTVTRNGVVHDSLFVNSYPRITIGMEYKRGITGIFQKRQASVIYQNDNPYIHVMDMSNVVIKNNKKFYQTFWFEFGTGFFFGSLATSYLMRR